VSAGEFFKRANNEAIVDGCAWANVLMINTPKTHNKNFIGLFLLSMVIAFKIEN
jgi:hypothetical protein